MNYLDAIGMFLIAAGVALLGAGMSTYAWPTADGTMLGEDTFHFVIDQTPTGVPAAKHSIPKNTHVVREQLTYTYTIDNSKYVSNNVSLLGSKYIRPGSANQLNPGGAVSVAYLPLYPSYSVIKKGPPNRYVLFLVLSGALVLKRRRIARYLYGVILQNRM